jgi:hypothetical protein
MLAKEIRFDQWGNNPEPLHDPTDSPRAAIADADLITITVSANDIPWYQSPDTCGYHYDDACIAQVEKPFIAAVDEVLASIDEIRGEKPTAVRLTTFYNDLIAGPGYDPAQFFPAEAIAQAQTSAHTFLDTWNADLCATAEAHGDLCVDVYHEIQGPDALDAIPGEWFTQEFGDLNQDGQDDFARLILEAGVAPLDQGAGA